MYSLNRWDYHACAFTTCERSWDRGSMGNYAHPERTMIVGRSNDVISNRRTFCTLSSIHLRAEDAFLPSCFSVFPVLSSQKATGEKRTEQRCTRPPLLGTSTMIVCTRGNFRDEYSSFMDEYSTPLDSFQKLRSRNDILYANHFPHL